MMAGKWLFTKMESSRFNKIFTEEEILEEVAKLQYCYGLKQEIRYGEGRFDQTESVAEHIYGMHVLASYFLELEDPQHGWDSKKIFEMITWHDMDELETGDVIGYLKTQEDRQREADAVDIMISKLPEALQDRVRKVITEYQSQETTEARFVKALDKIEPLFHLYNENGKTILNRNKTTQSDSRKIKDSYVAPFPYMRQFNDVINERMEQEGYFAPSPAPVM